MPIYGDGAGGLASAQDMSDSGIQPLLAEGGAWVAGATSAAGYVWTYSGQRWCDLTGAAVLPASPTGPRFVFVGVDTSGVSNTELAYAENVSGSTNTSTGANVDVTSCSIAVPATSRPVYLSAEATLQCTSGGGTGTFAGLSIVEVSNGVDTPITWSAVEPEPGANYATLVITPKRLAASTARTRNFKLQISSTGATVVALNGASFPSYIAAESR